MKIKKDKVVNKSDAYHPDVIIKKSIKNKEDNCAYHESTLIEKTIEGDKLKK